MTSDVAARLADKRAQLEHELGVLSAPTDQSGISFGKRVGDGTAMAVERLAQVAAHERLGALRADVLRAQQKLQQGSWGRCDACGGPIPAARLEAMPWAVRCVACAGRRR